MTIRSTMQWVDSLRDRVPVLTPEDLSEKVRTAGNLVLVDIRELQERIDKGAIPGSHHVPRGMLEFWADPAMGYHRDFFTEDADYVLYCAGGGRSVLASIALMDMGYRNVSHLGTGFDGWAKSGRPVENVAATSRWVRRS